MIPRILHYVWVGPKPIPASTRRWVDQWRRLHPGYRIELWNERNIDFGFPYLRAAYDARAWNRVSDFVRMWALARHGGIYLDHDVELRRPLDDLLGERCFFGFQSAAPRDGGGWLEWVNGAVIGAEPGHWFIDSLHRAFGRRFREFEGRGAFSGPGLITTLLLEEGLRHYADAPQRVKDITLFPVRWFYPYGWDEAFSESAVTPDTYAIHHWDALWVDRPLRRLRERTLELGARLLPGLATGARRTYRRCRKALPGVP